jgi:hypothetical protein
LPAHKPIIEKLKNDYLFLTAKCVLPLKPDWSFFAPLIFSESGDLITTENVSDDLEDISLDNGAEVILSCTPNYFKNFPSEKTVTAKCKDERTMGM